MFERQRAMKNLSNLFNELDDFSSKSERVTLADLGDDWVVPYVSIVDKPAVPKATFISVKGKNTDENKVKSDRDFYGFKKKSSKGVRRDLYGRRI